ncbi:flagellar biosynthesis protein FlgC [Salipaludibacillus neizhouensis]|uniref:Flagellar biosynthesis protein FlgC n=1 Tax=Salipaludibacillus neizhouensis TaxID=885475 RepID=A0A3A9KTT5_9BACI|nr:flagellar hook-basal body protein [Salipaludibacillus neizhouensis]RKL68026.1 flagellar biosynthesis protein FlgC [Salipaludibacillus neizhouensis]
MLRGLYAAGAGMISQQRKQEMLSNNIANINTPGYKEDQGSLRTFPDMMIKALGTDHIQTTGSNHVGTLATGVYMQEQTPNFTQGDIQETGNNTDVALLQALVPINEETDEEAMLVFETQNDNGDIRYTRNGNFAIDSQGTLTNSSGHYILGVDGNPITVNNENITINSEGQIFSAEQDLLGQINVAVVTDPGQLVKEGEGLFRYDGDNDVVTAVDNDEVTFQLQQGFVERSNVDATRTMTEMMTALRTFEANQKVLQAYDQTMQRTVNDVGKIG